MDETTYHRIADRFLEAITDQLETQDTVGLLEVELAGGVLTIELPSGKQFVVSKHTISRQMWLSSPLSGGLHFPYTDQGWVLSDQRELSVLLAQEISQLAAQPFTLKMQ
jgi:iron donor protein CyaY